VTLALAVLLLVFGSVVAAVTVAVLVIVDPPTTPEFTMASIVIVTGVVLTERPDVKLTVTVPALKLQASPVDELHDENATVLGKVSATLTPLAGLGPALVTEIVYVMVSPGLTEVGKPVIVSCRSALTACPRNLAMRALAACNPHAVTRFPSASIARPTPAKPPEFSDSLNP